MTPFEPGGPMIDEMGIFRTTIEVAHLTEPARRRALTDVLVDTGAEYSWVPRDVLESLGIEEKRIERFETADGRVLTRPIGYAMLYAAGRESVTILVFAE